MNLDGIPHHLSGKPARDQPDSSNEHYPTITYTSFFGLTDDWARLHEGLKATLALGRERFSDTEWQLLNDLAAERAVLRR